MQIRLLIVIVMLTAFLPYTSSAGEDRIIWKSPLFLSPAAEKMIQQHTGGEEILITRLSSRRMTFSNITLLEANVTLSTTSKAEGIPTEGVLSVEYAIVTDLDSGQSQLYVPNVTIRPAMFGSLHTDSEEAIARLIDDNFNQISHSKDQ